jgi:hypothetical protein
LQLLRLPKRACALAPAPVAIRTAPLAGHTNNRFKYKSLEVCDARTAAALLAALPCAQ